MTKVALVWRLISYAKENAAGRGNDQSTPECTFQQAFLRDGIQIKALAMTPDSSSTTRAFNYELALTRLGGDRELFTEVLGIYLEDAPALLGQAAASLASDDMPSLQRASHTLKGLAANFGAAAAVAAAYAVELHAGNGQRDRAAKAVPHMEAEIDRLGTALRDFRDQPVE